MWVVSAVLKPRREAPVNTTQPDPIPHLIAAVTELGFALRAGAIRKGWSLPAYGR